MDFVIRIILLAWFILTVANVDVGLFFLPSKMRHRWLGLVVFGVFTGLSFIWAPKFNDYVPNMLGGGSSSIVAIADPMPNGSITKVGNRAIADSLKRFFNKDFDGINGTIRISHKLMSAKCGANGVYAYFSCKDSIASNLRIVIKHSGGLQTGFVKFVIDGTSITYRPQRVYVETVNSKICEKIDDWVTNNRKLHKIMKSIMAAETPVRYRLYGKFHRIDKELSIQEKNAIIDTYNYYLALGGELNMS